MTLATTFNAALITILMATLLVGCGAPTTESVVPSVVEDEASVPSVVGINALAPAEVTTVLPQAATQPTVVAFKTKYCHDCQEMAPHIAAMKDQHPGVSVISVDVQYDKETYGHIIEAFKPSTVPTVVYIKQGGAVHQTLLGRQERVTLQASLEAILSTPEAAPAVL